MRESKAESIQSILKLIDSCIECSRKIAESASSPAHPTFHLFAERVQKDLSQFEFELRLELGRLGAEEIGAPPDSAAAASKAAFELALERYEKALRTAMPARTRAMLKRQCAAVVAAYDELLAMHKAA